MLLRLVTVFVETLFHTWIVVDDADRGEQFVILSDSRDGILYDIGTQKKSDAISVLSLVCSLAVVSPWRPR